MSAGLSITRACRNNGLLSYLHGDLGKSRATAAHLRFHQDLARHRAIIKGNQVGGTRSCSAEMWLLATETHPWRKLVRQEGKFWIAVANWSNGYHAVCRNMWATCPQELVDWSRSTYVEDDERWVNNQIILRDGCKIEFRPSSGGSLSTASATLDGLWIDEPPARSQWGELHQRVKRRQGPVWVDCTPVDKTQDLTWFKHELEGDPSLGIAPRLPWSIHRIRFLPENVPWMTRESVILERTAVRLDEAGQRNDGDWEGEALGRRFKTYNAPLDTLPEVDGDEADVWHLGVGIDWGEGAGKTVAVLVAWRVNRARLPEIRVLGEYVSQEVSTVSTDAAGVQALLLAARKDLDDVENWVGDTNTLGKGSPGRRINAQFEAELGALWRVGGGLPVRFTVQDAVKVAGAPDGGVALMQQAFARGLLRVDGAACPVLDRALRKWEGGDDDYKHPIDALRYVLYPILVRYLGRR